MDGINLWIVILLGGFGGLLHALYLSEYGLLIPKFSKNDKISLNLGFLSDVLLGIGAAVAILYFILPDTLFKQVSLSLISGFGGGSFLGSLTNKMGVDLERGKVKELEEVVREYDKKLRAISKEIWAMKKR